MAYSKEVVARARARLAGLRADRESENAARLEQAYAQVPRLRQIDLRLRGTMAAAAQAVFAQGGDAAQAMEKVKEENLALQAERKALEQTHFASGYLDSKPICEHCGGSGYVGANMCDCLKALCVQEQRKELGQVFSQEYSFEAFSLDYYSDAVIPQLKMSPRAVMSKTLNYCRQYARSFSEASGSLLFNGGTGLGKSNLALAIGRAVGEMGCSVCYETAISLFNKLEKARFNATEQTRQEAEKLESCDLLIIDDLGTELSGQFTVAALYGILDQRLRENRSMIITTNLNVDEVAKRYSPQIASRLYGQFRQLTFLGSDIRILKNRLV